MIQIHEDIVYKVGLDETITYISGPIEKLFGYKPDEVIGTNIKQLLTHESYIKQKEGMMKATTENRVHVDVLTVEVIKKDGEIILVDLCAKFEKDELGKVIGILGSASLCSCII